MGKSQAKPEPREGMIQKQPAASAWSRQGREDELAKATVPMALVLQRRSGLKRGKKKGGAYLGAGTLSIPITVFNLLLRTGSGVPAGNRPLCLAVRGREGKRH